MQCVVHAALGAAFAVLAAAGAHAADAAEESLGWHGQATYIRQVKPGFDAAYSGPNSLQPQHETSYSFTATAALGARPWRGGELYLDGELVQGVPLSGLVGLGGLTNGELQKTAGAHPVFYRARAFLRQSWALGDEQQLVASGFNQLAGMQAARRLVLSVGNLAVSDLFDNNRYAHDARTQFLSWALLTHGHFDFAADSRGYSNGAALEWFHDAWALRAARFEVPQQSNGLGLDHSLGRHHGDQLELQHDHVLASQPGTLRLLAFHNRERMARFDDALDDAAANPLATGGVPDLARVRREQSKRGWGLSAEQSVTDQLGGFMRLGRHDGATEPYSFASIDNAISAGAVLRGAAWRRADDQVGLARVSNGLSAAHRRFLAAGGIDFFLGDGQLRYGRETTVEGYYSAALTRWLRLSLDLQHISRPGYNRDRGPVHAAALRLHAEL